MNNSVYLCKPGGDIVAALEVDEGSVLLTESAGELWELSFDMHRYMYDRNGSLVGVPYYGSVAEMMELFLDSDGCRARFLIDSSPTTRCDGTAEVKTVTAHSLEAELQHKFLMGFQVNTGKPESLENLVKGDAFGNPADPYSHSHEIYDYNINPYTNLPVDYITVSCRLAEELEEFLEQFKHSTAVASFQWTFKGEDSPTTIWYTCGMDDGAIRGADEESRKNIPRWYDEFTDRFPRVLSDIIWGWDDRASSSSTNGSFVCVADAYLAKRNDGEVYVPLPVRKYHLSGAGWHITDSDEVYHDFNYFLSGLNNLVNFYRKFSPQLGLLEAVLERASGAGWTVGDVPASCVSKKYSFEADGQDIYSFLMNEMSRTMKVMVSFDTVGKKVSIMDLSADDREHETGIVAGFHNLLQSVDVTTGTVDGIKTTFRPKGADGLGIEYVNFGSDSITDLNYFINKVDANGDYQYGTAELHRKYGEWEAYRETEAGDYSIPSYTLNLNTKEVSAGMELLSGVTRRQYYSELSKAYNKAVKDISDLTYLVPSDGAMTDYTTYPLKDLKTVALAYVNAYNTLIELYKTEYGRSSVVESEIIQTYFYQDWKLYKDTIIPNIVNALKIYAKTDADGTQFLDEQGNVVTSFADLYYPDGGNPSYNGKAEIVTENKSEGFLYDMTLYGLSELNIKRKAWAATAAQIYKDAFVKSGTPGTAGVVYRTWAEVLAEGVNSGFASQDAYEKQLNTYLDYMSTEVRANSLTKAETKGVVCMAIEEIDRCEAVISQMEQIQEDIGTLRSELANSVTYEGWGRFTDKELRILHTLSHEADYSNENILITNLDDVVTMIDAEQELYEDACKKLFEKSRPQYSFQIALDNVLAIEGFEPMKEHLKLLNYFYLRYGLYDDETLKLRIVGMSFNPIIKTEEFTLEFSNMTYTFDGVNDFYYLFDQEGATGFGGSSGGGSSSGGGTYGANDAEITISNNMLNALLKNQSTANSLNLNNILSPKQIESAIAEGELSIDGAAIMDVIKSQNYNGHDGALDNTEGSIMKLNDGTFSFAGGRIRYTPEHGLEIGGLDDYYTKEDLSEKTDTTVINGGNITTGRIQSKNEKSWIDLDDGKFYFGNGALEFNGAALTVKGEMIGGIIKSENYDGTSDEPDPIINNTQGSVIELTEGKFNFGGNLKYDGEHIRLGPWDITVDGFVEHTDHPPGYLSLEPAVGPEGVYLYNGTDTPSFAARRKDSFNELQYHENCEIYADRIKMGNGSVLGEPASEYRSDGIFLDGGTENDYRITIDASGIKKLVWNGSSWETVKTYINFD